MRYLLLALAVVAAGLMPAGPARTTGSATPSGLAVWAVGDSDKIGRDDARSPLQRRNGVWDGHGIHIFGARNEVVAFQIILYGGATGARRVDVALTPLRNGRASIDNLYAPRPADPNDYRGKRVELFREHYHDLGPAPVRAFPQPGPPPLSGFVPEALGPFT